MNFRRSWLPLTFATVGLMASALAAPAFAQEATPTAPLMQPGSTIQVTGTGSVEVPADGAVLQMVIYSNGYSGGYFEESVAIEGGSATPGAYSEYSPVQVTVSEEQIASVTDALAAAGLDPAQYEVKLADSLLIGYFSPGAAILGIQLNSSQIGDVDAIVSATRDAANGQGLSIDQVSVAYQINDCAAATKSASSAALADGQLQAKELADLLGVQLGNLVGASRQSVYDNIYLSLLGASSPCDPQLTLEDAFGTYFSGGGMATDGMVVIFAAIELTYETA